MEFYRRENDPYGWGDTARVIAIIYTIGYFAFIFMLFWKAIPENNTRVIDQLVAILSINQTGIVGFYFGGSKAAVDSQKLIAASKERAETTVQDIAKASAPTAAAAVAASVANPQAGTISTDTMNVTTGTMNVTDDGKK